MRVVDQPVVEHGRGVLIGGVQRRRLLLDLRKMVPRLEDGVLDFLDLSALSLPPAVDLPLEGLALAVEVSDESLDVRGVPTSGPLEDLLGGQPCGPGLLELPAEVLDLLAFPGEHGGGFLVCVWHVVTASRLAESRSSVTRAVSRRRKVRRAWVSVVVTA